MTTRPNMLTLDEFCEELAEYRNRDSNEALALIRHDRVLRDVLSRSESLLAELEQLQCGCTTRERDSGHRTDCRMPWVRDAEEKLREAIAETQAVRI